MKPQRYLAPMTTPHRALPRAWVIRIFARLEDRYGAAWADRYGASPRDRLLDTWAADLGDLSAPELARGLQACRDLRFPPTLPQFRQLCRPAVNHEAAFHEAVEQLHRRQSGEDAWSHPAIYWTATRIGAHELRNATWATIRGRWTAALDAELAHGAWPPVPPRLEALPAPGRGETNAEQARAAIGRLRDMLAGKMTGAASV